jgi:hypothetical protein
LLVSNGGGLQGQSLGGQLGSTNGKRINLALGRLNWRSLVLLEMARADQNKCLSLEKQTPQGK